MCSVMSVDILQYKQFGYYAAFIIVFLYPHVCSY